MRAHNRPQTRRAPLRVAVMGTGAISKEHLTYLAGRSPVIPDRGLVELVGVCDQSPAAAHYAADTFGAGRAFTDLADMLESASPEVVHVLTPPASHVGLATQCLQAGAHVVCEKPITTNSPDLDKLLEIAADHGRQLMESHNYRFNHGFRQLENLLNSDRLGPVRSVDIRIALPVTDADERFGDPNLPSPIHQLPAGVIHDFTTHFSYLLLRLTGDVVFDRMATAWSNHAGLAHFRYDDLDALLIGNSDRGPIHARLRFEADSGPDTFAITVRGTEGWAEIDLFQPYLRAVLPRPVGSQLSPVANHVINGWQLMGHGIRNLSRKIMQITPYEGLHHMLDETYQALTEDRPVPVTPAEMLAASRLVDTVVSDQFRF